MEVGILGGQRVSYLKDLSRPKPKSMVSMPRVVADKQSRDLRSYIDNEMAPCLPIVNKTSEGGVWYG